MPLWMECGDKLWRLENGSWEDEMREIGLAIEGGLLIGCVWILLSLFLFSVCCHVWRGWKIFKRKRRVVALLLLSAVAVIVGGTKNGIVTTLNDPYITVDGSYTTNEFVHVEVQKRYDWLPNNTEIWIWSREIIQTNEEDWVKLVRVEEGEYVITDFPLDIPFPNATNYDFLVAANYVPEPSVHTNGVWTARGFIIDSNGVDAITGAFPFSKVKTEEE